MFRMYTLAAAFLLGSHSAAAKPIAVWLQSTTPTSEQMERVDRQLGEAAEHLAGPRVMYLPSPMDAYSASLQRVESALKSSEERWEDFEVERQIAEELREAVAGVTVVADPQARGLLQQALWFEGSAVVRSVGVEGLERSPELAPYLYVNATRPVPEAWVSAYGHLSSEDPKASMFPDGTSWNDFRAVEDRVSGLETAVLRIHDAIGTVVLNGEAVETSTGVLEVRPGRHWVHQERDGQIYGAGVIDAIPGGEPHLPRTVPPEVLERVAAQLVEGVTPEMSLTLRESLDSFEEDGEHTVFLVAMDGKRPVVAAYGEGELTESEPLVTLTMVAGLGGMLMDTPLFERPEDRPSTLTGGLSFSASLEVGISYGLVAAGVDVFITPGASILRANRKKTDNVSSPIYGRPWIGAGAYILRPLGRKPTLSLMFDLGWLSPAYLTYGGRLAVGVPTKKKTWFRMEAFGGYSADTLWKNAEEARPTFNVGLRFGLGAGLK